MMIKSEKKQVRVKQFAHRLSSAKCVFSCYYDGLPCDRFIDVLNFGACYVKDLDGKLLTVCPRFRISSSVSLIEDFVPEELIPK
jgi:hypothetical protein